MLDKVCLIEERYEELNRLMARPEVATDMARLMEYAQEQAQIGDLVQAFRRYSTLDRELADARSLLDTEADPEMRPMAEEGITRIEGEMGELYGQMRAMLLPKDPRDEKNVI